MFRESKRVETLMTKKENFKVLSNLFFNWREKFNVRQIIQTQQVEVICLALGFCEDSCVCREREGWVVLCRIYKTRY